MKVAFVHDYLTEYGGAEKTLAAMHELWPDSPVFTSLVKKEIAEKLNLSPTPLTPFPFPAKAAAIFLPFIFENLDLRGYDTIVSSGTIWSKSVLTTPDQLHIFYCHTPPRFLYKIRGETNLYQNPLLLPFRLWDFETARRPDYIIANSRTTAKRIEKFWRRNATVIYPPVETHQSDADGRAQGSYFLVVSRLSAYKNVDIAIEACNRLKLPLKIVGVGREEERLKKMAGPTVEFLGFVDETTLSNLYQGCRAVIAPASDEDFGIVPVEAMSYGKSVIALHSGGHTETVIEGKTGLFFDSPTVESLVEALSQFDNANYQSEDCVNQARKFSKERFQREFKEFVENARTSRS